MKITREQLHKAIAERLEPKPTFSSLIRDEESEKGFWYLAVKDGGELVPEPVNFSESEDASARLLDAMPDPYLKGRNPWMCNPGATEHSFGAWASHRDRKTAVVLAAQRWLEIEGELE